MSLFGVTTGHDRDATWAVSRSPIQIFNPIIQYKSESSGKQKRPYRKVFFIAVKFTAIPCLSEFPSLRFEASLKTVCVRYRQHSQRYRIYHR